MHQIKIKPLSVNQVWLGRHRKTPKYRQYEQYLLAPNILPDITDLEGKLQIDFEVGYSNKLSDIDNCIKPFLDILQKKYGFNDSQVYRLVIEKKIVKKGEEYISFNFSKNA